MHVFLNTLLNPHVISYDDPLLLSQERQLSNANPKLQEREWAMCHT
jgi:hypothetical protein